MDEIFYNIKNIQKTGHLTKQMSEAVNNQSDKVGRVFSSERSTLSLVRDVKTGRWSQSHCCKPKLRKLGAWLLNRGCAKCPAASWRKTCINSRLGAGIWRNREHRSSQLEAARYRLKILNLSLWLKTSSNTPRIWPPSSNASESKRTLLVRLPI